MTEKDFSQNAIHWRYFLQNDDMLHLRDKKEIFSALASLLTSQNNYGKLYHYLLENFSSLTELLCSKEQDWEAYSLDKTVFINIQIIKEAALRYNRAYLLTDNPLDDEKRLLDYLITQMAREPIEQFRILFFDKKKKLIIDELQTRGTINHTQVYPREISKRCLELKATSVILVHNHPSGDATPSSTDILTTQQVQMALRIFHIEVIDHYIIARKNQTSLKKLGLLSLHQDIPSL